MVHANKWQGFRENAAVFAPQSCGLLCPVCLRSEADVPLTDGHVFPDLCRSSDAVVPECKNCNCRLGSIVDSAVVALAAVVRLAAGKLLPEEAARVLRSQATIKQFGGTDVCSIGGGVSGDRVSVQLGYKGDKPSSKQLPNNMYEVQMQFQTTHSHLLVGGLLHTGFLRMFEVFGYEYVFDVSSKVVREHLIAAVNAGTKQAAIGIFEDMYESCRAVTELPSRCDQLFVLRGSNGNALAFAVFVPYGGLSRGGLVMLPGPGELGMERYRVISGGAVGSYRLEPVVSSEGLLNPIGLGRCKELFVDKIVSEYTAVEYIIGSSTISVTETNLRSSGSVPFDFGVTRLPRK